MKVRFILLFILVIFFFTSCDHCYLGDDPSQTSFFLKGKDALYLVKAEYFAEKRGLFQNYRCYSNVHIYKFEDLTFKTFKDFKIYGDCDLNKSYLFNVIYPLTFPTDEYVVTWWKERCMIVKDPVSYSVRSTDGVIVSNRSLFSDRGVFEFRDTFRFGDDLFYTLYRGNIFGGKFVSVIPDSNKVELDCVFPEKIKETEIHSDPSGNELYYFSFVTHGVDIFNFSVKNEDEGYRCNFSPVASIGGEYKKVFFSYPFFAGEQTTTSNSVDFDLINVENQKRIHYSFTFTTDVIDTNPFKSKTIWILSGLFKFKEGVLFTFSREEIVDGYPPSPDHFTSAWYFEDFKDSGSERRVNIKFPMGWFSLVRSFGGMTQYGDYVYAMGELSSDFRLDNVEWHIFEGNFCKSPWRREYPVYRGGYDGEEFTWEKIGDIKFNCNLEW